MKLLLLLAAIAATPAASPQRFDLICSGSASAAEEAFEPADVHIRVDLDAKRWCMGDCVVIGTITDVQPGAIWFEKENDSDHARGLQNWRAVNRQTGAYHYVKESRLVGLIAVRSQCERAPFSGFPLIKTKF